jgi:FtsZ-binding cell division protein ZapB
MSDLRQKLKERISRAIRQSRELQGEIRNLKAYPPLPEEVDHAERFIEALIRELERIGKYVQTGAALYPECRDGRHDGCPKLAQASYCACLCHEPKIMEN